MRSRAWSAVKRLQSSSAVIVRRLTDAAGLDVLDLGPVFAIPRSENFTSGLTSNNTVARSLDVS
jgi:hypothetical protein